LTRIINAHNKIFLRENAHNNLHRDLYSEGTTFFLQMRLINMEKEV